MANFVSGIIQISISIVIFAGVYMSTIKSTNTSYTCANASGHMVASCTWSASELAIWGVLGIVGIAGIINGVMNLFGMGV